MTQWTLKNLLDEDQVAEQLTRRRLSPAAAVTKAPMFARAARALAQTGAATNGRATACYVPGRVELLGKEPPGGLARWDEPSLADRYERPAL